MINSICPIWILYRQRGVDIAGTPMNDVVINTNLSGKASRNIFFHILMIGENCNFSNPLQRSGRWRRRRRRY